MTDAIQVQILGLMPAANGMAVFLGNDTKTFSIHVDHGVGTSIALLLKGEKRERPLTHDLIHLILHSILHLIGYDHEEEKMAKIMEDLEVRILKKLKIKDPYQLNF